MESESTALEARRSARRPRWLPGARHAQRRSRAALVVIGLAALLVFLFARALHGGVAAEAELLGRLAAIKALDARWDGAILKLRAGVAASAIVTPDAGELAQLHEALAAAAEVARGQFKEDADALTRAYLDKAELAARFAEAHADTRDALAAAMRAEAAVAGLVRAAWGTHSQHERLVAAENLVALVLAQAQQYHHTPTPLHRTRLEEHVLDLRETAGLPPALEAALGRLETDVHQILLVKPLEQMLFERLLALDAASRLDALTQALHTRVAAGLAREDAYRFYLVLYLAALALLVAGMVTRAMLRARVAPVAGPRAIRASARVFDQA